MEAEKAPEVPAKSTPANEESTGGGEGADPLPKSYSKIMEGKIASL